MRPPRPISLTLKVADLDPRDRLAIRCPKCGKTIGQQGYDLGLEQPADLLVIRYVTRHWCRSCSRPGSRIRAEGFIEPHARSGAEGGDGPSRWRAD